MKPQTITRIASSAAICLGLALLLALPSPAQALYKCGNSYQDKPCTGAAIEAPVNPAIRNATAPAPVAPQRAAASPFAPECGRIGVEAQRVVWQREAGATQEKQIAEVPRGNAYDEMVKTINAVFSRRGTAPEIRAAVEAECLVEKQRQADAVAMLKALNEQAGNRPGQLPAVAPAPTQSPVATNTAIADPQADARTTCKSLRAQDDAMRASQASRGDAATMKTIREQRSRMEEKLSAAKC